MNRGSVIALSGGLDSTTLLAQALFVPMFNVRLAVAFRYGSKHGYYENQAALKVAEHFGIPFHFIDLTTAMAGFKSALMPGGADVPHGHYEEESMRQTVVPFRNGIFAAMLAGVAESEGLHRVLLATHAGDHFIYPDCRPTFNVAMAKAIQLGTDEKVRLELPYETYTKTELVTIGLRVGAPYHLTRTCYANQPVACGRCGSCQERLEAFELNGKVDPLEYETREILPKQSNNPK